MRVRWLGASVLRSGTPLSLNEALPDEYSGVHDAALQSLGARLGAGVRGSEMANQSKLR